jgi:hypothetical protein
MSLLLIDVKLNFLPTENSNVAKSKFIKKSNHSKSGETKTDKTDKTDINSPFKFNFEINE